MNAKPESIAAQRMSHGISFRRARDGAAADVEARVALADADWFCALAQRPEAERLLLRGLALEALGDARGATANFIAAQTIDPTHEESAHRLLRPDVAEEIRAAAAGALVASPRCAADRRRDAARTLVQCGREAVARLRRSGDRAFGWVIAPAISAHALVLLLAPDANPTTLSFQPIDGDPDLVEARLDLACPPGQTFAPRLRRGAAAPAQVHLDARDLDELAAPRRDGERVCPARRGAAVVIPLYDDVDSARICVASVVAQTDLAQRPRLILVNDNPASAAMAELCEDASLRHGAEIVRNAVNLGFVGAVNRGIAALRDEDALVLNSDAALPPDAVSLLRRGLQAHRNIGVVAPLSNNGELCSFPAPLRAAPVAPSVAAALHATAKEVNRIAPVVAPYLTGFCLYISRDCLDAVGGFDPAYGRGYYEDVDFCLRAREAGFLSAVATRVYVAHAGSTSFGQAKHALIETNRAILKSKFPGYAEESLAYVKLDPLRAARARIEAAAAPAQGPTRLLVTGVAGAPFAAARDARLRDAAARILLLEPAGAGRPTQMRLRDMDGASPQNLEFDVATPSGLEGLRQRLRAEGVVGAEVEFDAPEAALAMLLQDRAFPVAVVIDRSPLPPPAAPLGSCAEDDAQPCAACSQSASASWARTAGRLGRLIETGVETLCVNDMAASLLERLKLRVRRAPEPAPAAAPALAQRRGAGSVAVVAPRASAEVDQMLRALAQDAPERLITVFGRVMGESALRSFPNMCVAGAVEAQGWGDALRRYDVAAVFHPERGGAHSLAERLRADFGTPQAFFDWSFGSINMQRQDRRRDLALDPRCCTAKAARAVARWLRDVAPLASGTPP